MPKRDENTDENALKLLKRKLLEARKDNINSCEEGYETNLVGANYAGGLKKDRELCPSSIERLKDPTFFKIVRMATKLGITPNDLINEDFTSSNLKQLQEDLMVIEETTDKIEELTKELQRASLKLNVVYANFATRLQGLQNRADEVLEGKETRKALEEEKIDA